MTKGRAVVDRDGGQVNNRPQISPLRCAPVEMTKGRGVLPATVVAEQDPFFIALTSPDQERTADTADLSTALRSGRDDKGEMGRRPQRGLGNERPQISWDWAAGAPFF